jgi:uncharacterized protein (DUF58 family)
VSTELTFPLVPRRRLIGLSFGPMHSARRGTGSDVAGSRPYLPGDDIDTIDWSATARLSSARDSDEFIVRERYAEEAPHVLIVCDRRPEMALYPAFLPWLRKPDAMRAAIDLIADSALHARGLVGYLDCGDDEAFWQSPRSQASFRAVRDDRLELDEFHGRPDNLVRALAYLEQVKRRLPAGSFVFVLSDFLAAPSEESWAGVLGRWDVVPVVIQDPVWEASFPDVSSIVVPLADPTTGKVEYLRLTAAEARERREANERRRRELLADFEGIGLDPVEISASDRDEILQAFLEWAEGREYQRARGW